MFDTKSMFLALACAASPLAIASAATAQEIQNFEIAAGPLAQALQQYSRQADVTLVAPADLTRGKQGPAVAGRMSAEDALSRLLDGSGLMSRRDGSGVIVIERAPESNTASRYDNEVTEEITVAGFRSAFKSSLETKRSASQVMDAISSEEFGQFPDQNIAEAVQRISGVSLTRNNGEGESVTIRGLSPTFTRVEVDGRSTSVTIDSSDPERASVLSVFSSDLYQSIEVIKSPTAADVEGGLGGIVRLKTPSPIDIGELRWGAEVAGTLAENRDEAEPEAILYYSNVFADETFGFLFTGTFEDRDRRIDKVQSNLGWTAVEADFLADPEDPTLQGLIGSRFAERFRQESKAGSAPKINLNAKLQYKPSDDLDIKIGGTYTSEDRSEQRSRLQIQWGRGQLESGTLDAATGTLTEATFTRQRTEFRSFDRQADITTYGVTANAEWTKGDWTLIGDVNFTKSEENFEEIRADVRINRDGLGGYDITGNPEYPSIFTAGTTLDPSELEVRLLQLQRRIISIEEVAARLDAERRVNLGAITAFRTGVRFADTTFDRTQGAVDSDADLTFADGDTSFVLGGDWGQGDGTNLLLSWPEVDPVALYDANPSVDSFVFNDEDLYNINERSFAGYGLADFESKSLGWFIRGNIGARIVRTEYKGVGRIDVDLEDESEILIDNGPSLDRSYTDVLPAFNFVLSEKEDSNFMIRGAITRAMTRPTITEMRPSIDINLADGEMSLGNPELEPFRAWQYDLGIEYYFGEREESAFTASFFYKDVSNFIVDNTILDTTVGDVLDSSITDNPDLTAVVPLDTPITAFNHINGGDAEIKGFEVGFQTPLSMLPGPLSDLGIFANYTFTDSEFTTAAGEAYPFPGASKHTYNLVLYYEKGGFSSRVAFNFRDDFLITPATEDDGSNAVYGDNQGRLDFAARYRFKNGIRISFDALNLTKEQNYRYFDTRNRLEDLEFEGRIFKLGLAYTF